ncbi:calcium-binding protein [Roseovarius mucosus]|uniref:calcium-binding protein n=1 Tax=Roseovarius mucosus TaxID=215743 RepID=UPI003F711B03
MIRVVDQTDRNSGTTVTPEMFGTNLTITTNISLRDKVIDRFTEANITNLRFPGGSITESHFDISDIAGGSHERTVGSFENSGALDLIAFSDFLDFTATLGTSTIFVIPTSVGFTQTAGEALLAGTYGGRLVSASYLQDVADFVTMAVQSAAAEGVRIDAFEIGNEFWGSGRMTAHEYGSLAAAVAQTVETTLFDLDLVRAKQPDIVVQTLSSAGVYSPNGGGVLYVDPLTRFVYQPTQIGDAGVPPLSQLTQVAVPSQGNAKTQNTVILSAFAQESMLVQAANGGIFSIDVSDAANAIDAVSEHYYLDGGLGAVDTQEQFGFTQLEFWRMNLGNRSAALPELDYYITEWNVSRTGDVNEANNRGLQHAILDVAMFYEMVTHDVTTAHYWPSLFNNSRSVTLVCTCRGHLTIAGESYSLLHKAVGMTPVLDFLEADNITIHGFENGPESFFILADLSGTATDKTLDFSAVLDPSATLYRVSYSELWDGGAGGQDEEAAQVVLETEFVDLISAEDLESFLVTMQAWSLVYLHLEAVTDGVAAKPGQASRTVTVTVGDDPLSLGDMPGEEDHHTNVKGPRFILNGGAGEDTLNGGAGDDRLIGGLGDDLMLGGIGDDVAVFEGVTFDTVAFSLTPGGLRVVSALGIDDLTDVEWMEFADQTVSVAEVRVAMLGFPGDFVMAGDAGEMLFGTDSDDTLIGGDGDDIISGGLGNDSLDGGAGNDRISASDGNDFILGGPGNDDIGGGPGNDTINGGEGDDIIGGGFGADSILGGDGNDVVAGGADNDTLSGGAGNDSISGSFGSDLIFGNDGADDIGGGTGQDTINAGAGDDSVGGGEGNDSILGEDGNDFLAGGGRDDTINGGTGDDTINGGSGSDRMSGGAGTDQFVFSSFFDGEVDVITDFEDGVDSFFIRRFDPDTEVENITNGGNGLVGFLAALNITDTTAGAEMNVNGNTILVEGITAAQLTLEDFQFL